MASCKEEERRLVGRKAHLQLARTDDGRRARAVGLRPVDEEVDVHHVRELALVDSLLVRVSRGGVSVRVS